MFGIPAVSRPPRTMARTLRVCSALLSYPSAAQAGHAAWMGGLLRDEAALSHPRLAEIETLLDSMQHTPLLQLEAAYVQLFDCGRATSLHLFEHVHGDSRERGPAMIDLAQTYAQAGLLLAEGELPDYLPALLEFVSTQPPRQAHDFLAEMAHILAVIHAALHKRRSAYAAVLGALLDLAGAKVEAVELPVEPALDETWAEPVVFDGCSTQGQARPGQPQPVHIVRKPNPAPGASA
jgi:nitrate reductase molybdenum cofactor assembly chaperone NarJ/NarW